MPGEQTPEMGEAVTRILDSIDEARQEYGLIVPLPDERRLQVKIEVDERTRSRWLMLRGGRTDIERYVASLEKTVRLAAGTLRG